MSNIFFEPWVGPNYQSGGFFGKRVLILGESLYCDGCEGCLSSGLQKAEEFETGGCWTTKKAVESYINDLSLSGGWRNTYLKFERSLVNEETNQEQRSKIWNSLLFYNYLQVAMTENRKSGTEDDYKNAELAFFEVLEMYRPEKIIVWGRRLWQKMPGGDKWTELDKIEVGNYSERVGSYKLSDGTEVQVMSVYHPSVGYSWDYWYQFIHAFINK